MHEFGFCGTLSDSCQQSYRDYRFLHLSPSLSLSLSCSLFFFPAFFGPALCVLLSGSYAQIVKLCCSFYELHNLRHNLFYEKKSDIPIQEEINYYNGVQQCLQEPVLSYDNQPHKVVNKLKKKKKKKPEGEEPKTTKPSL